MPCGRPPLLTAGPANISVFVTRGLLVISCLCCRPWFACHRSRRRKRALYANLLMLAVLLTGTWHLARAQQASQVLHHHVRREVTGGQAPLVGSLPPQQKMNLSIMLPLRNQAELASLLQRLYDPTSPDFPPVPHRRSVHRAVRSHGAGLPGRRCLRAGQRLHRHRYPGESAGRAHQRHRRSDQQPPST